MSQRHLRSSVLSILACWLMVLASGDDFNFARVVLSPLDQESEDLLPLDDPNADFTELSAAHTSVTAEGGRSRSGTSDARTSSQISAQFQLARFAQLDSSHGRINTPLRC